MRRVRGETVQLDVVCLTVEAKFVVDMRGMTVKDEESCLYRMLKLLLAAWIVNLSQPLVAQLVIGPAFRRDYKADMTVFSGDVTEFSVGVDLSLRNEE